MKCFYHNDLDGQCAAFLVYKDALGNGKYISMDYSKEPDLNIIEEHETIYIVDYHFKDEVMEKLLKITKNIIWIDHHKTIMDSKYNTIEIKGIRSIEKSGCELTWDYLYKNKKIPFFVSLIGDYDTWIFKYKERTEAFHEGMMLYDTNPKSNIWRVLFRNNDYYNRIIDYGRICIEYRKSLCRQYIDDYSFEMKYKNYNCLVCNIHRFGSKTFNSKMYSYDICITVVFNGQSYIHGLYTINDNIDVSEIAKELGGGGHKGAAGFISDKPIWKIKK